MRMSGRHTRKAKTEKSNSRLAAMNTAAMCENNWGQTEKKRWARKWYYLDADLLQSEEQLIPIRREMWMRN
jgi:hypothetical protein